MCSKTTITFAKAEILSLHFKNQTSMSAAAASATVTPMDEEEEVKGLDFDSAPELVSITCGKTTKRTFDVDKKLLLISNLIATALGQDKSATQFPCAEVESSVFEQLLPYIEHRKGTSGDIIPYPAKSDKMKENCSDVWDAEYIDTLWTTDRDIFYKVMMAANYMDIRCLLHLCACKVGTMIKGCPYDKIKEILVPPKQ